MVSGIISVILLFYKGSDWLHPEKIEVNQTDVTSSSFSVLVQIVGQTTVKSLNVAYIATDPTFPYHLNSFDNVPINSTFGPLVVLLSILRLIYQII